jgi:drug/metabolite transporter (DMT)-like permease
MKTILVLSIATLCAAIGETFLSYGMRSMGEVSWTSPSRWLELVLSVVKNFHVTIGVVFLALFFFLYLATLSWADLSYALPITSMSFIFGAILAKVFLNEQVSWRRWAGTVVILAGICLVATDQKERTASGDKGQNIVPPGAAGGLRP